MRGYGLPVAGVVVAGLLVVASNALAAGAGPFDPAAFLGVSTVASLQPVLDVAAVVLAVGALYVFVRRAIDRHGVDKRERENVRNVLRLLVFLLGVVAVLAVLTDQWLGLLFSLGVIGFAVTFALQQPLFSLIGWLYILVKEPYRVGDRVSIDGTKGDVVSVDFFVTTLWEIDGELVAGNQPSGRAITVPNSAVLSSHVFNFTWEEFPWVWNEIAIQVAYETDLEYAIDAMTRVADDQLGDAMAERIEEYRRILSTTAVELDVQERPTVNVVQKESWVELRLRYLVHPRRGQRTKNELYEGILAALNDAPDRVKFPVGRNR